MLMWGMGRGFILLIKERKSFKIKSLLSQTGDGGDCIMVEKSIQLESICANINYIIRRAKHLVSPCRNQARQITVIVYISHGTCHAAMLT